MALLPLRRDAQTNPAPDTVAEVLERLWAALKR